MEKRRATENYAKKLKTLFDKLDVGGDGAITCDHFEALMKDPENRIVMSALGIDPTDVDAIFRLLDDGDGSLTAQEFVEGATRIRGQARAIDMAQLLSHARRLEHKFDSLFAQLNKRESGRSGAGSEISENGRDGSTAKM